MKPKNKPYDIIKDTRGRFKAANGGESVNSPNVTVRLTTSQYQKLNEIAGKNKTQWVREAIAMRLAAEEARLIAGKQEPLSPSEPGPPGKPGPPSKRGVRSKTKKT